jgi:hypothetical protein
MSLQIETIVWDGQELRTTIVTENGRVTCTIPREVIHGLPSYSDALGWEIDRHKSDIFQRVQSVLLAKLRHNDVSSDRIHVQLSSADLSSVSS